jgi:hypothetical protein
MSSGKRQRSETREQILGDVVWSYASVVRGKKLEGVIMDESRSGMSILTHEPVASGSLLEIFCRSHWNGARHVTVKWCRQVDTGVYRCGLTVDADKKEPQR